MPFLILLFPIAEIYTYVRFVSAYSFMDAILYTITSAALGIMLMSLTGKAVMADVQKNLAQQKLPTDRIMHRAVILLGGLLIFIPGILSDIIGALCLLPGTRHLIVSYAKTKFAGALSKGSIRFFGAGMGNPGGMGGMGGMGNMGGFATGWPPPKREERDATVLDVTPISISHTDKKSEE